MTTSSSFFSPGKSSDKAYENIRDGSHEPLSEGREFTEILWKRYAGLEDRHFLSDARAHFLARFWEMYLAVTLTERGLVLNRGGEAGPDFLCLLAEHRFWVEAVVPEVGHGPDGVPEHEIGVVYDVPVRQILLRLTNSVAQKKGQYAAALQKGPS